MNSNKVRFIINPISGINRNPKKIVKWIHEIFQPSGAKYDIVYTEKPGDGTKLAEESVKEGFNLIGVAGGDGTINEVGRGLCRSEVALGVIPSGSGNGFARNLKIPLNQFVAIKKLLAPKILTIDMGKINDHLFLNQAGFGLDAEIGRSFQQFGIRGPLPYFIVGTQIFFTFQPEPVKLYVEKEEIATSPLLVCIANGPEYGNGAIIAPSALPDDGLLNVIILEYMTLWEALPQLYKLFNGTIDQIGKFKSFTVKNLTIERASNGIIHTDGDPHYEKSTLNIDILPNSLKVAVSEDFSGFK